MFLEVKDLSVDLGEFVLDNINLSIEKGEYLILIGPTGSGKSVLLETIIGFYKEDSGLILLNGVAINNVLPENRHIGIVYQDNVLFPNMNVYENIMYGLKRNEKLSKEEMDKKVKDIAKSLEISHILMRNISTLSGGESQRTALARALIVEPELVLMDEPFSALDVSTQSKLISLIKKIGNEKNTTFLHVTHNFNDIWNLADKVGIMKKGKLHQLGTVFDVFSKPVNDFVADFVGVQNIFEGTIEKNDENFVYVNIAEDLTLVSSDIKVCNNLNENSKVLVAIRSESIIFSNKPVDSSARNTLKGMVDDVIVSGPVVTISADVGGIIFKGLLTRSSYEYLDVQVGKSIYLILKSLNVNIIDRYNSFKVE